MSSDTTTELKTRDPLIQGSIKTDSGTLHWDFSEHTPITLHGHLPFFAQFMQSGNLFSDWVKNCPLVYSSNNAPKVKDVLGTIHGTNERMRTSDAVGAVSFFCRLIRNAQPSAG